MPDVTRSEIEAEIADEINRSTLTSQIRRAFDRAHRSIQRRRNFKCMERISEETLSTAAIITAINNGDGLCAPDDIKKPYLFEVYNSSTKKTVGFFNPTTIEVVRNRRHTADNLDILTPDDDRLLCAIWAGRIYFYPNLSSSWVGYKMRLHYHRWLPALASTGCDWFTSNARDYLFYYALEKMQPFIKDDSRITMWAAQRLEVWNEIIASDVDATEFGELVMRG